MVLVYLILVGKEGKVAVKQIETRRLILRSPMREDAVSLLPIRNSEFVLQFNPTIPKNQEQLMEELMEEQDRTLILEKKKDGKVIGACFFGGDALRYRVNSQTLSYYLAQEEAGKGYMTEAVQALMEMLFEQGVQVLSLRCYAENAASVKLAEKLGFVKEGCIRYAVSDRNGVVHDDCIYSLIREDYLTGGKNDVREKTGPQ